MTLDEGTNPADPIGPAAAPAGDPAAEPADLVRDDNEPDPADLGDDGAEGDDPDAPPADDTEEIEYDGKKHRVPKELKDAFLRQQDYTRKTQEVAERGRALETERETFAQQAQAFQEHIQEVSRLVSIDDALAQWEQVDWNAYDAQDPTAAASHWRQFQQLKEARQALAGQLQQKSEERARAAQQETAERLEETVAFAKKEIRNWSPELDRKITTFVRDVGGLTDQEIRAALSPKAYRLFHLAYVGHETMQKAAAATAKPNAPKAPAAPVQPLTQVAARSQGSSKRSLADLAKSGDMEAYAAARKAGRAA